MAKIGGQAVRAAIAAAILSFSVLDEARAQGGPAMPSSAAVEASPAARRLREAVEALDGGDAAVGAYVAAHARPAGTPLESWNPFAPMSPAFALADMRYRAHGYEIVRYTEASPTRAAAWVMNKLTGLYDGVIVEVEPQAPHRVVSIAPGPAPTFQPPTMPTGAARMAGVEALLKRLSEADVFSGVVLIAENGRPIFQQAYGYADREKRVPNTMNTRFRLASLNKIFTGLAIGRLVEQGKLSYEDPLSKFIPDYPDPESARRIRIKHLLSHTSGLGTYFNQEFFRNIETMTDMPSVMAVAGRQPPEFEPGTKHRYSNVGFHLLGRVIEQVTGEDYYAHMERTMFRPLGLGATGFPHFDRAGAGVALPYETRTGRDGRIELAVPDGRTRRGGPAGDAASSAPDLLRFANALQAGEVVSPETLRLHSTPKPELGAPRYGYGMTQPRIPFRSYYGHGGDAPGSCTDLAITRDTPYTVIVLSNSSAGSCRAVVEKILVSFWPDKAAPPRRGAGG